MAFADGYRSDRVGWHEITARGEGVRLVDSPVALESVSDELRAYPNDLLSSPLAEKDVELRSEPGNGASTVLGAPSTKSANPFTRVVAAGDRLLQDTIGREDLTLPIGLLAALLSILIGAGHAMLPGHGKTVMAAYLAGRRGSRKDAVIVGATVTATHTVGVLVLGVLIFASASLIGEQVLRWLGVLSGVLIAAVGVFLLRDALRARHVRHAQLGPAVAMTPAPSPTMSLSAAAPAHTHRAGHGHDHAHVHSHDSTGHDHDHVHDGDHSHDAQPEVAHSHGLWGHHDHGPGGHSHGPGKPGRRGLIGMGVAGGLVPSPSALIVLLASFTLHRTVFGILLVLLYGLGMAGTLTIVGLLLVRMRGRIDELATTTRIGQTAARIAVSLPLATAGLVLVVGLWLAVRGFVNPF